MLGDITISAATGGAGQTYEDRDVFCLFGTCSSGTFGARQRFSFKEDVSALGSGSLATMAYQYLLEAEEEGRNIAIDTFRVSQYFLDDILNSTEDGSISDNGSVPLQPQNVNFVVTTTGGPGTAVVKYTLDEGDTYVEGFPVEDDGSLVIEEIGINLILSGTFTEDETFTIVSDTNSSIGEVTTTRAGETTGTVDFTDSSPLDNYTVRVLITGTGLVGEGSFKYCLDLDDNHYSREYTIPVGGTFEVPNSGVVLTFADGGSDDGFVEGDLFVCSVTGSSYTLSALDKALTEYFKLRVENAYIHVLGVLDDEGVAMINEYATNTAFNQNNYAGFLLESFDKNANERDASYETRIKNVYKNDRASQIQLCVGYMDKNYGYIGATQRTNSSRAVGPLMARESLSVDPGYGDYDNLKYVSKLYYNGYVSRGLERRGYTYLVTPNNRAQGFKVAEGRQYYIADDVLCFTKNYRVFAYAASLTYAAALRYINSNVAIVNGRFTSAYRNLVSKNLTNTLEQYLIKAGHCLDAKVVVPDYVWDTRTRRLYLTISLKLSDKIEEVRATIFLTYGEI